ncbi:MAG: thiamine pyrophosphate-dependent enzyme [Candidatus Borkfalkia sp.]
MKFRKYDTLVICASPRASPSSQVELCEREERHVKEYKDIAKYVMMPANAKRKHVVVEERLEKLSEDANGFSFNQIEEGDGEIGIICAGGVYQFVKEALPNASVLKLGMSYPLPYKLIEKFAKSVKRCIVAEELAPHIETLVKAHGIKVEGKNLFPLNGEFSASLIRERVLGEKIGRKAAEVPARPPVLCSGCPHRGVFYVLSNSNSTCSAISAAIRSARWRRFPPWTRSCMGASIGMAIGFDKADPEAHKHSVAVIGDSTFCHSGVTGLMDAVYNRSNVTVIIRITHHGQRGIKPPRHGQDHQKRAHDELDLNRSAAVGVT